MRQRKVKYPLKFNLNIIDIAIRRRRTNSPGRVFKQDPHRINEKITAHEVRLVGDNVEVGVYSLAKALFIAQDLELDLVEISPNASPPVCKILEYKKFLYEQKKREKLKAFVFFKGRSIIFKEKGQILLLRLAQDLEDIGKVEQMPELEGKKMIMFIAPKKNK